jgi:hypothetical protein
VASMIKNGIVYTISAAKLKYNVTDASVTFLGKFFNCLKKYELSQLIKQQSLILAPV